MSLQAEIDAILAFIDDTITANKSTIGHRQWEPTGKLAGQPKYPLLAVTDRDWSTNPISKESHEYTVTVVLAALEKDVEHDRGQQTTRGIAESVADLFNEPTDLPGAVFSVSATTGGLNMATDRGEAGATVTLTFRGYF